MVNIERDFHMASGEGEGSYAKYSRRQTIVIHETKPVVEKATIEVYRALLPKTMVIADLGCSSSGPNTMLFMSHIIGIIADLCSKLDEHDAVELQFLNDLPGNDFNQLFRSLENIKNSATADHKGGRLPSYYISGLPKSYYSRLFPRHSVHLFHSSYCLHWRSQVPEGLVTSGKSSLDEENIYIRSKSNTTPLVVKLFQEQFRKNLSLFLELRHEELVEGGQMVLALLGRKDEDVYNGNLNHLFGFVADSLQSLVVKVL
uniref:Jasmonate O-methyltransferase n=1 Tax=Oryza brachyantha TaxID=4533 RepID=J3MCU6_ORYBR